MPFSILSLEPGVTRIALEGDLDIFTIERLWPELLSLVRKRPMLVEVDLSRLRSVATRGTPVLIAFFGKLTRIGCRVAVVGLRDQPLDRFEAVLALAIVNASQLAN